LARRISDGIVEGKLPPRTRLPTERELMDTYGVSRTVVREAIAALRSDGLVETRQGSGAFVAADLRRRPFRIDPDGLESIGQVLDVMELRIGVEVEAAGLAAERRARSDIDLLAKNCRAFAVAIKAGDHGIDLDFAFHAAIGAATRNPYFSSFLDFIGRMIIPRRTIRIGANGPDPDQTRYLTRILREHETIVAAIGESDVAGARRAMRDHLSRGRERYRRLVEGGK
jgi:GntR family transcriptional regulator, transcriptional repressor for pyruvate dehydrogenase complex